MSDLQAGRERDAQVAEEVMGISIRHLYGPLGIRVDIADVHKEPIPHYSTDIAAAFQVVEHWEGDVRINRQNGAWRVEFFEASMQYSAWAETAPLAICRAALAAVGHADDEQTTSPGGARRVVQR